MSLAPLTLCQHPHLCSRIHSFTPQVPSPHSCWRRNRSFSQVEASKQQEQWISGDAFWATFIPLSKTGGVTVCECVRISSSDNGGMDDITIVFYNPTSVQILFSTRHIITSHTKPTMNTNNDSHTMFSRFHLLHSVLFVV